VLGRCLVDIGLELVARLGWATAASLSCLHDVFILVARHGQSEESAVLACDILRWAGRPVARLRLLLGLALAFLELQEAMVRAPGLLGEKSWVFLRAIVARERRALEECARQLRGTDCAQYGQLVRGYRLGGGPLRCVGDKRVREAVKDDLRMLG